MRLLHKKTLIAVMLAVVFLLAAAVPAAAQPGESYITLVNKENMLSPDYVPGDMTRLAPLMSAGDAIMRQEAAIALAAMAAALKEAGAGVVYGSSGYRSYDTQSILYQRKVDSYRYSGYSLEQAQAIGGTIVAPPGSSEHQSGLAIDLTTSQNNYLMEESFADTAAGQWLAEHCWEYGFILRYGQEQTAITGYVFEPWHFRYVGQPHAAYMAANKLTLEEYHQQLADGEALYYVDNRGQAWLTRRLEDPALAEQLTYSSLSLCAASPGSQAVIVTARLTPVERDQEEEAQQQRQLEQMLQRSARGPRCFPVPWRDQGHQPPLQALLEQISYKTATRP